MILHHGATYVEAELCGKRGIFLFDTGANTSGVDVEWIEGTPHRLDGSSDVGGTTGAVPVLEAVFHEFRLGPRRFRDARFLVQSFAGFTPPAEGPQVGLIGTDYLNDFVVTIDYDARVVDLGGRVRGGEPLEYVLDMPNARVRVGGVEMRCRLDSGAAYIDDRPFLDVNRAAVEAMDVPLVQTGEIYLAGVGGTITLPLMEGGLTLEIAGTAIENVVLVVHDTGTLAVAEPLALAGAPILRRLGRFTIDPARRVWVVGRP